MTAAMRAASRRMVAGRVPAMTLASCSDVCVCGADVVDWVQGTPSWRAMWFAGGSRVKYDVKLLTQEHWRGLNLILELILVKY